MGGASSEACAAVDMPSIAAPDSTTPVRTAETDLRIRFVVMMGFLQSRCFEVPGVASVAEEPDRLDVGEVDVGVLARGDQVVAVGPVGPGAQLDVAEVVLVVEDAVRVVLAGDAVRALPVEDMAGTAPVPAVVRVEAHCTVWAPGELVRWRLMASCLSSARDARDRDEGDTGSGQQASCPPG